MQRLKSVKNLSPFFKNFYIQSLNKLHGFYIKVLAVLGVLDYYLYQRILEGESYVMITSILISLFILLFILYIGNILDRKTTKVIPYFNKELSKDSRSFVHGKSIFWQSKELSLLLEEQGLTDFSVYISVERDTWFSPSVILPSLDYLILHFQTLPKEAELLKDLEVMKTSLKQAEYDNILFCFHCRFGNATHAQEHERGKGSYF